MKNNICCILNIAAHYRAPIYRLMDRELACDFYIGDTVFEPIKRMDYDSLTGYRGTVTNTIAMKGKGFIWQKGIWKLLFKGYDHYLINSSPYYLSNWPLLILAKLMGKRVYAWTHGMKRPYGWKQRIFLRTFYKLCHAIFLYGEQARQIMIDQGFQQEKLHLIYNSLDYAEQLRIRKSLSPSPIYTDHFKQDLPVLIYIGRIQKSKKIDLLVEAVASLQQQGSPCNLVIVGKDVENNDLPGLVQGYGLTDQVWFYGPCYEEALIGPLLYNADVCISPGLIGLTAIHALTYGTPVITSDDFFRHGPEFEAIVPGISGDFFKEGNLDDLCAKITDWIGLDPQTRAKVRESAYAIVEDKYNPSRQIELLKKVFQQ